MAAALHLAGMEPWDVTMSDLLAGRVQLSYFRGAVFVGGFSYADVLDSAKGWAGTIRGNARLWDAFNEFYMRCAPKPCRTMTTPLVCGPNVSLKDVHKAARAQWK